jgi:hypothetical protein
VNVLGPIDAGKRALVRAPTVSTLCDALAAPAIDVARSLGRLRIDVDPRRAASDASLRQRRTNLGFGGRWL